MYKITRHKIKSFLLVLFGITIIFLDLHIVAPHVASIQDLFTETGRKTANTLVVLWTMSGIVFAIIGIFDLHLPEGKTFYA